MRSSTALSIVLLGLALAPHGTSAARNLKQWGTRSSSFGSFGSWQQTPSQQTTRPISWPTTYTPSPFITAPAPTTATPTTTYTPTPSATTPTTTTPGPTTTVPTTTTTPTPTTTAPTTTAPATTTPSTTLPTTTTPATSSGGAPVLQDVLDLHNQLRAQHSAAPLSWSSSLAQSAQSWSQGCVTQHSSGNYGENLAWGYSTFTDAVNGWYNEGSQYNYNNPGFSSATGHFTQVVWKSTTQLGCAVTQCGGSAGPFYVCQYSPPGNYAGQFPQNVSPS